MLMKTSGLVRLASDVEIRYSQGGTAVASFSVASSTKFKNNAGEQQEKTCFIQCVAFSRLAEICNQFLRKGSQVYIIGSLELEQWTANDGSKRSKHKISLESIDFVAKDKSNNEQPQQEQSHYATPTQPKSDEVPNCMPPEVDIDEDEIPF